MNRKGFSLVELSIVLVIIGILMGMVIKGKSMIESAKLKKEVNKIVQIKNAIFTDMALRGDDKPPYTTLGGTHTGQGNAYSLQYYIDNKLLDRKNSTYEWHGDEPYIMQLVFILNTGTYDKGATESGVIDTTPYIGIGNDADRDIMGWVICGIERTLDDESTTSGDGRNYRAEILTLESGQPCNVYKGAYEYFYRID